MLALLLPAAALALQLPKNPFASKTDGATVMKVQIAFRVPSVQRGASGVLGALDALADSADASTAEGLEELAADTALLLLRREREWIACAGSVTHFGEDDNALRDFDRQVVGEAAKFDRENADRTSAPDGLPKDTLAIVSALACCMGDREDAVGGRDAMLSGNALGVKALLQELAAAGQSEGEVFGFELMWVPDDDDETVDMDDVMTEWPEVMTC